MPRGKIDLSNVEGNPTKAIQDNYHDLMAVTNPEELKALALKLVEPYVGHSFSTSNFRKFKNIIAKLVDLSSIQSYLTNFMLKGSNLGIIESTSQIDIIAALINESNEIMFTPEQQQIVNLVSRYGYSVALTEDDNMMAYKLYRDLANVHSFLATRMNQIDKYKQVHGIYNVTDLLTTLRSIRDNIDSLDI